jgi:hypothetical protein
VTDRLIGGGPPRSNRPQVEDILRAAGYLTVFVWATLFMLFPPSAFVTELDGWTRSFWLSITMLGALAAAAGSFTRIDIKLEFPGILIAQIGPMFYFASQLYYVVFPSSVTGGANSRIALIAYAILPGVLLLPRTWHLYVESRKLKRLNDSPIRQMKLSAAEQRQPGAFHRKEI